MFFFAVTFRSVICPIILLKLSVTPFTPLHVFGYYDRIDLTFFGHQKKIRFVTEKNPAGSLTPG